MSVRLRRVGLQFGGGGGRDEDRGGDEAREERERKERRGEEREVRERGDERTTEKRKGRTGKWETDWSGWDG